MTSLGEDVLVLANNGQIFAVGPSAHVRQTEIDVPDNGLAAYRRAAETPEFEDFAHSFDALRYNDIVHIAADAFEGLAISFTEFDEANGCYRNAVALLPLGSDIPADSLSVQAEDWDIVFRTAPCLPLKREGRAIEGHMAGGRMAFAAPSTLYLTSGDFHWDGVYGPKAVAQRGDYDYGKIIAIDLESRDARQVSRGHRNPQGIAIDDNFGLWVVDHGPRGGDELNKIVQDENYGWPLETLGTSYSTLPWPLAQDRHGRHDRFHPPIFAWLPAVAPSSLIVIDAFDPSWDHDLLMGTLADQSLHRIRIVNGRALHAERIPVGHRIRHLHQHSDGRLVLWTDDHYIIFLEISPRSFVSDFIEDHFEGRTLDANFARRVHTALENCMQCHSLEPSIGASGPSLAGIFEAPIAATSYPAYSEALTAQADSRWTEANLTSFLADPQGFALGTSMPNPGLGAQPAVIDELVELLRALSRN
jgi:cytochrome c2